MIVPRVALHKAMGGRQRVYARKGVGSFPMGFGGKGIYPAQRGFLRTGGFYGRFGSSALGSPVERKFHDVNLADSLVSNAGTIHSGINLIAQGVTESTRVGRVAFIKSIFMREAFQITESAVQTSGSDHVRTMIILDKQANGAAPAVSDIITAPSVAFFGFNQLANKSRFKILYDKITTLRVYAAGGNGTAIELVRTSAVRSWYKKFKNPIRIEFDDTTGAVTEIRSNNFVVLSIAKQGIVKWDAAFRLRFTD